MMPKIDGYEVCQRLKADENTKYIPILMLTAKGEVEDKIKGLDIGADDYLSKPFDYKELSARARSLLTTKAAHEKKVEEEKSGALEQMMDQVAHEIRNPLTAIGGFARKVYRNLSESDPNRKYMEIILEDVTVLENMIKQLIELKSMDISYKEPTNINDVIQESLNIFEHDFKKNGIQVNKELFDSPPLISTDKKLFTRVLCNLIKNSIEAMESGNKILTITTRLSGDHFSIIVSDTGKGIPKDNIKNIFDPLVTSKVYGPGLGLPFALKIVQDHGGHIDVESEPEKGTTFTVTIPLQET
jgi:signal transduction histidine kinase